jgi:hypothetical protein
VGARAATRVKTRARAPCQCDDGREIAGAFASSLGFSGLTFPEQRLLRRLAVFDLLVAPVVGVEKRRSTGSSYPESVLPVRVAAGALGPDAPHRDLLISQEHALCVDGVLIKAADLINGSSITLRPDTELSEIEYLHVKLTRHDVIFAEGAPSETLIVHAGNDERFDNFAEYLRLYGEHAAEEAPYTPIAFKDGRERLLSRLRSAASPWFDRRNEFDKARDRIEELSELAA